MADEMLPTDRPTGSVCPWCSASLTPDAEVCPSCGAILTSDHEHELPGVTAVDPAAVRSVKKPRSRSRLFSWISGEYPDDTPSSADAAALALPDPDVQREIRRLALEAEVANLQAEADAIFSEAVAEGRVLDVPEGVSPFAMVDPAAEGETSTEIETETPADGETPTEGRTAAEDAPPA